MAKEVPLPPDAEFGAWVCTRKQSWSEHYVVAGFMLVFGLCMFVLGLLMPGGNAMLITVTVCMIAVGIGILVYTHKVGTTTLYFYRSGVVRQHEANTSRMAYVQAVSLTHSATRMHYNGIYTGTKQVFKLEAAPAFNLPTFEFSSKVKEKRKGFINVTYESNDPLRPLIHSIAELLGTRLVEAIAAGHTAPWVKGVELRADGLIVDGTVVPFTELREVQLENGVLTIKKTGKTFALKSISASATNFLPGYFALCKLNEA